MKEYFPRVDFRQVCDWIGLNSADNIDIADSQLLRQTEEAVRLIESSAAARYTYAVFDIDSTADTPSAVLSLKGTALSLSGNDIALLLRDCRQCIILAVTIGGLVDRLLRKAQVSSMSDALILDLCASSAAENLCEQISRDLEDQYEQKGLYLTDRFSPGYGDLPLSLQKSICQVLQTDRRLGLTANSSDMLIPSKSITAVIGISERPQPKKISGCSNCKMNEVCSFRKAGKTCE